MAGRQKVRKLRKDSQLIIRINGDMRDAFVTLCDEQDTTAAREIRRFITDYLERHASPDGEGGVNARKPKKGPEGGKEK